MPTSFEGPLMTEPLLQNEDGTPKAPRPSPLTARALFLGAGFAAINSIVVMFFNFRYPAGLSQYWVIIVSYCCLWAADSQKFIKFEHPMSVQEHGVVTLTGTSAAFVQALGLYPGLGPLMMFEGYDWSLSELFLWTYMAGAFGVCMATVFARLLLLTDKYPWPVAKMNARTIQSFHGEDSENEVDKTELQASIRSSLKVFMIFFLPVLVWYILANVWIPFLVTFPILCWVCSSFTCQVLGEGMTGMGFPGFGLGPSMVLAWNGTIVSLETLTWLAVGAIFNFWILTPALYFSGNIDESTGLSDGVVLFPAGLDMYAGNGVAYEFMNPTCSGALTQNDCEAITDCVWKYPKNEGWDAFDDCSPGKIHLSATMWLFMVGICFTMFGNMVDAGCELLTNRDEQRKALGKRDTVWFRRLTTFSTGGAARDDDDAAPKSEAEEGLIPEIIPWTCLAFLSVFLIIMVKWVLKIDCPLWVLVVTTCMSIFMAYGLGMLMGTSAQNMAFQSGIVLQLFLGMFLNGEGTAALAISTVNNVIVAQAVTLMNDCKTGLYLKLKQVEVVTAQLVGTAVGVFCSVIIYHMIWTWNQDGTITLGEGQWANIGMLGAHLFAELAGEFGLVRIFADNKEFMVWSIVLFVIGVTAPVLRRKVSPEWRPYVPNTILIGLSQFISGNAFTVGTAVVLALVYQVYLRNNHSAWFKANQMVSTSGANAGVGIGGLFLLAITTANVDAWIDVGGPSEDGCNFPASMPEF